MGVLADWQIERDIEIIPFSPSQKRKGVVSYGVTSYGYDMRCGYQFRVLKNYPMEVVDPKNFRDEMFDVVDLTPHRCILEQSNSTGRYHCIRCGTEAAPGLPEKPVCPRNPKPNYIDIPPHGFVLAETLEKVRYPRDVLVVNIGKSTYARCGLIVNDTPGEPEWLGVYTLELTNTTGRYLRVYAGEGIMQSVFLRSDARYELGLGLLADLLAVCEPIADRGGEEDPKWKSLAEARELCRRLAIRSADPATGKLEGTCDESYADKKGKYQDQSGLTLPTVDGKEISIGILPPRSKFMSDIERAAAREVCARERDAAVEVVCPRCNTSVKIPIDRVESYTDRTCPVCKADMPFLPAKAGRTFVGNVPPTIPAPGDRPPASYPHDQPWQHPTDKSIWRWSETKKDWVQVTDPERKK
jgi:dCTP deaminase